MSANNRSIVRHEFEEIILRIRGVKRGEPLAQWEEFEYGLKSPEKLLKMKEKQKKILKHIGKGALYIAATGGAYYLAKGILNLMFKGLPSEKEMPQQKSTAASSASTKI